MRAIIEQVGVFHHFWLDEEKHNLYPLQAEKVAERSLPLDAEHLRRLASDVSAMTDALCELRAGGRGVTPQVKNI